MTEFPTDPKAYRVVTTRHGGTGPVRTIQVEVTADGRVLDTYSDGEDGLALSSLLAAALDLGRYAPDAMPCDEDIIAVAMDDAGITPDEDEDASHERDTFVPAPSEVPADECPILIRLMDAHSAVANQGGPETDTTIQTLLDASDAINDLTKALRDLAGWASTINNDAWEVTAARNTLAKWEG